MNIVNILQLISLGLSLSAVLILLITLHSLIRPVYIIDRIGNRQRAIIRMAKNIPNNGLLYRCLHGIEEKLSVTEIMMQRREWIETHLDEYADMLNQLRSRTPYNLIKVRIR